MTATDLDAADTALLQALEEDARTPTDELAETVGISPEAVEQRIESLEERGIITKFTALTDPAKLGHISVAFGISTEPTKTDEIAEQLRDIENAYKIWILSGRHNIIVHANFKDIAEFQDFSHETLHGIDGIGRYESSIMTASVLDEGGVVLSGE